MRFSEGLDEVYRGSQLNSCPLPVDHLETRDCHRYHGVDESNLILAQYLFTIKMDPEVTQ